MNLKNERDREAQEARAHLNLANVGFVIGGIAILAAFFLPFLWSLIAIFVAISAISSAVSLYRDGHK